MFDVVIDAVIDNIKIVPFLFLTYFVLEWIEHKMSDKSESAIKKAGRFGPVFGGILGVIPQCGFSAAGSSLYAGRVISTGTLLAIYLSTSDEMLPIFISQNVAPVEIAKILVGKIIVSILFGFLIAIIFQKNDRERMEHYHIHEMCEHDHCHCEENLLKSALKHTLEITVYLLIITIIINGIIYILGDDVIAGLALNQPILGELVMALVGLIPNCAASVAISQLYIRGLISAGGMMAGLLSGAGVGVLVLFRTNRPMKDNFKIVSLLYVSGVIGGILAGFVYALF